MARKLCAFAWRSGLIEFGPTIPDGALAIARGWESRIRDKVGSCARHGWTPGVLLVPGVPEADSDEAAEAAFSAWKSWAFAEWTDR